VIKGKNDFMGKNLKRVAGGNFCPALQVFPSRKNPERGPRIKSQKPLDEDPTDILAGQEGSKGFLERIENEKGDQVP